MENNNEEIIVVNGNSIENEKENENESDSDDDCIWDDSLIIKSYNESLKLVKEEVAKKMAMLTNKRLLKANKNETKTDTDKEKAGSDKVKKVFKVGDYVRATYEEDGVDYEARVMTIDGLGNYHIKYIGYDNEETKKAEDLIQTWGRKSRRKQKEEAAESMANNGTSKMECSDDNESEVEPKQKPHKIKIQFDPNFMPGGSSFMIPPPPPMPPMMDENDEDESESMSAMLMSWYMSGYYTGLYHGQKMSQKRQRPS